MTPIQESGFLDRAVEKVFQGARWKTSAGPYPSQAFFIPQTSADFVSSRCPRDFTADGKRLQSPLSLRVFSIAQTSAESQREQRLQVPYPERAFSVRKHLPTSSSHHAYSIPRPGGKRLQRFRIPSEFSPSRKHLPLPLRHRPRDSRPDGTSAGSVSLTPGLLSTDKTFKPGDRRSGWHARGGGNSRTLHRWEDLGVTLHPPWVIQFSKNDAPF